MRVSRCACGSVEIEASGDPITSAVCYCDSCQEGARQIESATGAAPMTDRNGGTEYVLYRKDRVKYTKGSGLLKDYKLEKTSTTNRVVAACCNSPMVMRFDDAKHWTPMYRARFQADVPALKFRICTKFAPQGCRYSGGRSEFRDVPRWIYVEANAFENRDAIWRVGPPVPTRCSIRGASPAVPIIADRA